MYSETTGDDVSSVFDQYRGQTAPRSAELAPFPTWGLARQCTAGLTLISALTTMGLTGATAAPGAASMQYLPPVRIWRTSPAALSQAEIEALMKKLDRLKKYRSGWAGPGSLVPTKKAFNLAGDFIHYISEVGLSPPNRLNLSNDGEINFYWKRKGVSFDLGINRRSRSSFYARLPDGAELMQDAKDGLPRLSPALIKALT